MDAQLVSGQDRIQITRLYPKRVVSTISLSLQRTVWNAIFYMNSFLQRRYNTAPDFKSS